MEVNPNKARPINQEDECSDQNFSWLQLFLAFNFGLLKKHGGSLGNAQEKLKVLGY